MTADRVLAFDVSLHPRRDGVRAGPAHADSLGTWPTLVVPRELPVGPMAVGGDDCLRALALLPRMFVEPDGSFVWAFTTPERSWQVDGQIHEREGRVLAADLVGACPERDFDRLLSAFGWPAQPVMVQLVRAGVFLDEQAFRRHAEARFLAGSDRG